MPAELTGVVIGFAFVIPTIYLARKNAVESWAWPLFLVSLPVWYMLFGMLAMDGATILNEFLYGLPYIATGLITWRFKSGLSYFILAIAWLSHGFYDYYHELLFINAGVFNWYPAFCAVVDLAVGIYLLASCKHLRNERV
ncbi:MAG: hypothetical protein V7459_09690 [Oceanicoccus sp.]